MSKEKKEPSLFGLVNTNRTGKDLWGKNQFNSTFPVALACHMRAEGMEPVLLSLNSEFEISHSTIGVEDLFNCPPHSFDDLFFGFEERYQPYQKYVYDELERVDVVVGRTGNGKHLSEFYRPLEVKLTVCPDGTTARGTEEKWSPELVIRPPTTMYAALALADAVNADRSLVREIIEPSCYDISGWGNEAEVRQKYSGIAEAVRNVLLATINQQQPLVLQPIWKTQGRQSILDEDHALDIFVWTNHALCKMILDQAGDVDGGSISRPRRSVLRFARCMFDFATSGKMHLHNIYNGMTYTHQSDKDVAFNGSKTLPYMRSSRLIRPLVRAEAVTKIILNGGEKLLSPERRFDQTIYFAAAHFFQEKV